MRGKDGRLDKNQNLIILFQLETVAEEEWLTDGERRGILKIKNMK